MIKRRLLILLILCIAIFSGCALAAVDPPEFRGVSVHTWIPGMLSKREVDESIAWAKKANMNAIIVQARRVGDAYYKSDYEPRAKSIKGPGFDPLGYALQKGHKKGLEVHAWFNVYRVWSNVGVPSSANHVVNAHPEWLNKDYDGNVKADDGEFIDPGVPEAREYTVKLVGDLLKKYNVDGLMLDFIRYPSPGKQWGYSDLAVARFNEENNRSGKPDMDDPVWNQWRRDQVTAMAKAISQEVKRVRPRVKVSACTVPWGPCQADWTKTDAYSNVFQDWRLWMEKGYLDANMPMNYKNPTKERDSQWYLDWLDGFKRWSYGRHTYNTIMLFNGNVPGAVTQAQQGRERKMEGFVGFSFCQTDCKDDLATQLRAKVFANPAPVPRMAWEKKK